MKRIPATVVTGFLGAGKTSLIRHLLENADGRRIALIINEFGDLGIDRGIVEGCAIPGCEEDDIVELANGCICCTVADDFLPTITALLDRADPPDHIVIETSGLALPKPLLKAFAWPEVRARTTVDGVVTVIDAAAVAAGRFADDPDAIAAAQAEDPSLDHDNPLEELFVDQVSCADLIVINKADLVAEGDASVEAALAPHRRPGVRAVSASHGRLDPAVLLGLGAEAADDLDTRPSVHDGEEEHDHDDFDSFIVALGPVDDPDALERRLIEAVSTHDIFRIKGFAHVPGKPRRLVVQGVGARFQRYFDRDWAADERPRTEFVVIGRSGMDRAGIEAVIQGS
ncbi:MAG: cobalamin biosynthesis protein CobW [Rhodospirillaceae bacterium]|jgi:cobalamin biosynthesis protein CobW|nr:cobalamin biosynthesis protein CobW [Rhodospirillaceae bacterium]MBT3929479.1 cobalamin biosynthesis protein CobW [Rhodospirillaceae bacterium]MBT4772798.1 cobalamin biosynthesis protein CobW [Rhodospirillaceae bacterium]MBT5360046.1 cobalamin biosynthesis protein CobW [Rhodospirillaceae bacterium]MBT5770970.1 cobalamin biosynthesis protein CobW [Rhodospirillaceae bacterium]